MIFITGATGLLGSYLLNHLINKNKKVIAFKQKNSSINAVESVFKNLNPDDYQKKLNQIKWVEGSLFDIPFLDEIFLDVEEVYHCAGLISFDESKKKEIFKVNYTATQNLLNLSLSHQVKKFCYVSSIVSLGKSTESQLIDEESEFKPNESYSSYRNSKYASELEVFRACEEGLNAVIVNPGIIIGSHHWNRKSCLLYKLNDMKYGFSTVGNAPLVDVNDVVNCMFLLMENNHFKERFILISNTITYQEQNDIIRKSLHKNKSILIQNTLLKFLFYFSYLIKPFTNKLNEINSFTINALINKEKISNKKITEKLNYIFIKSEESLKIHTQNYLNYKNNESI